jgi:hypothetical protein
MKLPRRKFLHLAAGAAALLAVSRIACAETYPTRPVRLIVPIAAAGASDLTARLIGQWLSERLGNVNRASVFAKELVALQPDVILAQGTPVTAALQPGDADNPDCICHGSSQTTR